MRKMRISVNYADPHRRILSDAMYTQPNFVQIWWKEISQPICILCSKIVLNVLHNMSLTVLLPILVPTALFVSLSRRGLGTRKRRLWFWRHNTAAKRLRMRDLPQFRFASLAKMSPHESRNMARDTFPGWSLAFVRRATLERNRRMAAVWESVPCWFTFFLERSRLVWTPVSSGMYSLRTSMLCKTFASPIQLVSSENLLLKNFISWEKVTVRVVRNR